MRVVFFVGGGGGCFFLAGCELSRVESRVTPGRSLEGVRRVLVEKLEGEDWGFYKEVADEFSARGFAATVGEGGKAPAGAQAIVTYYDRWYWDMSPYLLELDVRVLDPKDRTVMAWAKNRRTSLVRASPRKMAGECVEAIQHAPVVEVNGERREGAGGVR